MKNLIIQMYHNNVVRYVFFGGLTTLVNLIVYYILRVCISIDLVAANIISIIAAILFAYFVNSRYVFETQSATVKAHFQEFIKFISARVSTMIIEVVGVWLLSDIICSDDMIAKCLIQFIILILNYLFSKFLVFTKK